CDYTLRKEIKLIRGGQHWIWSGSEKTFNKNIYFEPIKMKPNSKEVLNKKAIHELYEDLAGYLSILGENFDLQCPLTGGFDSRLIATLLVDQKLNAKYYTSGNPNHAEVKIASMVANKLNLPHQVYQIDYNSLLKNWDDLVKNLILNKNGLASLWSIIEYFLFQTSNSKTHSDGIIFTSDKIPVRLSTMAAEATRAAYNRAFLFSDDVDQTFVYDYLFGRVLANQNEILNDNAIEVFNNYFKKFFKIYIEKGVYYKFMPDIFFLIERVGRHHANKWGLNKNISDFFSMFCSKRYINTALKLHPVEKIAYPIHYRMMKMLNKEIFSIPFLHGKWPVQNKAVKTFLDKTKPTLKKYVEPLKRKYGRMKSNNGNKFKGEDIQVFDRYMIFNSKLEEIRSVCLDQSSSEIWQFIKKDKLEQILTGKCKIETPMLTQLYAIATVFYYQHFSQQKNGGN
ncbi:MAG: asparagine synthase-related protein, partial [Nitrososphaerales archaeon]